MSKARRVQLFFLVQFLSVGMINAFAGIWFASVGLTSFQIGVIGAAPIALMLALTLLVGRIADRASDWRQVIVGGMVIAGLAPLGLLVSQSFWVILLFWSILATAQRIAVPVADAAALRMARREGMDFGQLRGLSTIGYLLVIFCAGFFLGGEGVALFLPLFIAFGLIRMVAAFGLPNLRGPREAAAPRSILGASQKPWLVLPMLAWAVLDTNHIILNSFQGLLWSQQGISTWTIGILIAFGALAETVMFFAFARVARRFAPLTVMLAAAGFGVIRWVAMALEPGVPVLVVLQAMHALTYAMGFLAVTHFIADATSEDNAAEAQSLLVTFELAVSVPVLLAFGWIAGVAGSGAYLASAAMAAMGGALVVMARRAWTAKR